MAVFNKPGIAINQPTIVLNRWRKPGDITDIQKFSRSGGSNAGVAYSYGQTFSDIVISDASFIRFKNLHLAYNLPNNIMKKLKLQSSRIFVQGKNLFTITNY